MNRVSAFLLLFAAAFAPAALGQNDTDGSKDYPGITRMPGYYIYQYQETQFDSAVFPVTAAGKTTDQQIEGRMIKMHYVLKEGVPATSMLQVVRNYQNAARAAGGQVLNDGRGDNWYNTTLRLGKSGKESWILLEARSDSHWFTIVERQAMKQEVTIDAAALASGLGANGSVPIYGLFFDTAKAELNRSRSGRFRKSRNC